MPPRLMYILLVMVVGLTPERARAQTATSDDPFRFIVWLGSDVRDIGRGLLSPRPLALSGGLAVVGILTPYDEPLSRQAVDFRYRELVRILDNLGQADTMRPLALAGFLGTLMQPNQRVQDAAFTSLEALLMANVATNLLKFVVGRARPFESSDSGDIDPFSGHTSFPSGHTTTVFAAITPWFLYFPGPVTIGAMVIATGTGVGRVVLHHHWPTDVVAGAIVGIATSWWLVRNHTEARPTGVQPIVGPGTLGFRVNW